MAAYAKFEARCLECNGDIEVGERLIRDPELGWVHAECPEPYMDRPAAWERAETREVDPTEQQPGEVTCTRCWLIHRPGACDR